MLTADSIRIATLGPCRYESPLRHGRFVPDSARVRHQVELASAGEANNEILFEKAGPRREIYFNPREARAGIVTCGGLCPGLNNVIRSVFLQLYHGYGVRNMLGFRYGYQGLNPASGHEPMVLTPEIVDGIHRDGGTILGSSRGPVDARVMVDYLTELGVQILFTVGGDGTQRGASTIYQEAARRGYPLSLVGIPKTIDNDILYVWRTFGYNTALAKAREVIDNAHNEARAVSNGISIVKLMGREAGFIAAGATLASQEVNFTLVPEVPFRLPAFLQELQRRIEQRRHAVIVAAEGAGQDLFESESTERDASGNVKLRDIGPFLCKAIKSHFEGQGIPAVLRYFDPSYVIRSVAANTDDALLCDQLARNAVHAAMAGKTDVLIGNWYNCFVHVPISLITSGKKRMAPDSGLWTAVLAATGQPAQFA